MRSQEGASFRGGAGDSAGNKNWRPDVPVDTRGWNEVCREVGLPHVFPGEPQIFSNSISHTRETPTLRELPFLFLTK